MAPHYIITVSEGRFRVLERFARPGQITPTLREVASHDFMPAASALSARELSDVGRFPLNSSKPAGSEEGDFAQQEDERRRSADWLAEQIEHFLLARPGQAWAFAAGPNLHNPVLSRLRPSLRGSLVESVQKNLALTPIEQISMHFKVRA